MDWLRLAAAAPLAGLLALERKAVLQAMFSRPLVAGALLGLAFDRVAEGLAVGAALELFYLGAVNLGAALPDNELFTTVAAVACACSLAPRVNLPFAATLALAVLAAFPLAKLGKVVDRLWERLNGWLAGHLETADEERRLRTRLRQNLYGLWMPFLTAATACLIGALVGTLALPPLLARAPAQATRGLSLAWAALLVVAAASAARTGRGARASLWAGAAALLAAAVQALGLLEAR